MGQNGLLGKVMGPASSFPQQAPSGPRGWREAAGAGGECGPRVVEMTGSGAGASVSCPGWSIWSQVRQLGRRRLEQGSLSVFWFGRVDPGWNFFPFKKKKFLRCASFFLSAQACVLGFSPGGFAAFRQPRVRLLDVALSHPTFLTWQASSLGSRLPSLNAMGWKCLRPEGWTGKPEC